MQFKYPEITYFLFFLIIPILVHLFRLLKFQKEYFTNVKILRQIELKTRKSSQLKKWLLLASRLLLLTALILAFAQPFLSTEEDNKNNELYIVLDTSYSMEAQGKKGELLHRAIQDLLEYVPAEKKFSLLTNQANWYDTDIRTIQSDLQNIDYSPQKFSLESHLIQINAKKTSLNKNVVAITDGKSLTDREFDLLQKQDNLYLSILQSQQDNNVSIDSVYVSKVLDDFYHLKIDISRYGKVRNQVPVAMYNKAELIAKTIIAEDQNQVEFIVPRQDYSGYISIEDDSLIYDNTYYFTISKPQKIHITSIGTDDKNQFLSKIYTDDFIAFTPVDIRELDFNSIEKQNVIILNELEALSESLIRNLISFVKAGGSLVVIPSEKQNLQNINTLLSGLTNVSYQNLDVQDKKITNISTNHPLFKGVFEKRVDNFQYPNTLSNFSLKGSLSPVLSYQDGSVFYADTKADLGKVYLFSGAISAQNSNFLNSPLVVLSFYSVALQYNNTGVQSMYIANSEKMLLDQVVVKQELIKIKNKESEFIPLQQIQGNRVAVTFEDNPQKAGIYSLYKDEQYLGDVGFNYMRTESNIAQQNTINTSQYNPASIEKIFENLNANNTSNLWKLFLVLALAFVIIEILIQKLIK
ncbi:MAG: BatA domain-containing protein [Bacteroidota bacterium]|nr:BatA domain-containing protein [Bacteroidota bacterium]